MMWLFKTNKTALKEQLAEAYQTSVASLETQSKRLDEAFKELEEALRKKNNA